MYTVIVCHLWYCRILTKVTTTSISSRERPRARGAALGSTPSSKTVATASSASNITASVVLVRQHSSSPPAKARPTSRLEMPGNYQAQHLRIDPQLRAQSKSWDSGLDMFGAVPFSTPAKQVSLSQTKIVIHMYCHLSMCT